jgi:rare lipoprotein A
MFARKRFSAVAALLAGMLLLSGCSGTELVTHLVKKMAWQGEQETAGTYKIGAPYRVGSIWYYPREDFQLVETGIASWYGPDFHGNRTANGELYDQNELTAAHRTLQMPSLVRVTNLENGRAVVVRINDRGPFARGRVIDVSKRAAELLGFIKRGTARVKLEVMSRESQEMAEAAKRGLDTTRMAAAQPQPIPVSAPAAPRFVQRGPQLAALDSDFNLPESLQTPTITVEELAGPGQRPASAPPPDWQRQPVPMAMPPVRPAEPRQEFVRRLDLEGDTGRVPGRLEEGRFLPNPVVSQEEVRPTGIFVQAGAFAVLANAERMRDQFSGQAPVTIEPVTVRGRQLYRVKLGPVESVQKADLLLERVIAAGNNTARVIRR